MVIKKELQKYPWWVNINDSEIHCVCDNYLQISSLDKDCVVECPVCGQKFEVVIMKIKLIEEGEQKK